MTICFYFTVLNLFVLYSTLLYYNLFLEINKLFILKITVFYLVDGGDKGAGAILKSQISRTDIKIIPLRRIDQGTQRGSFFYLSVSNSAKFNSN